MGAVIAKAFVAEVVAYFEAHPEVVGNLIAWLLPHVISHLRDADTAR